MITCPICGNNDLRYFAYNAKKQIYCRKCIRFQGKKAEENFQIHPSKMHLDFSLSPEQEKISNNIDFAIQNHQNVFLYAVTGAGKTELVYKAMENVLSKKKQVGFVIPRKDVVLDLYPRISEAFPNAKVYKVYGGHHEQLKGDILILTSHQLYRYKSYFDLLIFDEIDAFPYHENEILNHFFEQSVKGNFILMSATPQEKMIRKIVENNGIYLELTKRYHGYPLPVPEIKLSLFFQKMLILKILHAFQKEKKPCFLFCPTIMDAEKLFSFLRFFFPCGAVVHSKKKEREKIIEKFKQGQLDYLVTTSILERGVTIKNLQVIIYHANHSLFDASTLVQISGRVGRKIDAPEGKVYYLSDSITLAMKESIKKIQEANQCDV